MCFHLQIRASLIFWLSVAHLFRILSSHILGFLSYSCQIFWLEENKGKLDEYKDFDLLFLWSLNIPQNA